MENSESHPVLLEKSGLLKECQWKPGTGLQDCPHMVEKPRSQKLICDNITDAIGFTPMVRLNNITKAEGVKWEILAKCEFMNPGGSSKDRITRQMILDSEKQGLISKGDIIIEPTSGNTGIGISLWAAALGYKTVLTMYEKVSAEKEMIVKGLGAEIVRTPSEVPTSHITSHIGVAWTLSQSIANCFMLDQWANPSNPLAHYQGTAQEIWDQCEGKVDVVVIASGTGGTITGIARFFKDKDPKIKIVGVDPADRNENIRCPADKTKVVPSLIEGVGADFQPRVLDIPTVDKWYVNDDKLSLPYSRRLIKEEGLLVGASSGMVLYAALEEAKELVEGQRIVILLADSIRNYMTKFVTDDWMYEHGFMKEKEVLDNYTPKLVKNRAWGQEFTVGDLPLTKANTIASSSSISEAIKAMGPNSWVLVVDENEEIAGVFTSAYAMNRFFNGKITPSDCVTKAISTYYRKTSKEIPLSELARVFTLNTFVVVDNQFVVTHQDVLNFFNEKL